MTVMHLEIEETSDLLRFMDRVLEHWMERVQALEHIARLVQSAWDAPATVEYVARVRGLRMAYARRLRLIEEHHKRAWHEYFEWLEVDNRPLLPWELYEFFERIKDRLDEFKDEIFDIPIVPVSMLGLTGTVAGGIFFSRSVLTSEFFLRMSKSLSKSGRPSIFSIGREFIGEFAENWKDYRGDPLRVGIATGIEGTVGIITKMTLAGIGGSMGAAAGAFVGTALGGPVGAVIGSQVGRIAGSILLPKLMEKIHIGYIPVTEWLEERVSQALTEPLADAVEDAAEAVSEVVGEAREAAENMAQKASEWAEEGIRSVMRFFRR